MSQIKRLIKLEQQISQELQCFTMVLQGEEQFDFQGDEDENVFYISFETPKKPLPKKFLLNTM